MTPDEVKAVVGDLRWMALGQGKFLERHFREHGIRDVLELGHMHGVSTCYFAGLVAPVGGRVVTCDLPHVERLEPNLETLLARCGLGNVEIRRSHEGGAWEMQQLMRAGRRFDFCYIDAGHTWECCGFQFYLALSLVRPGGWILFDDLKYSVATSAHDPDAPWVRAMTPEARERCQVREVWDLLVTPHQDLDVMEEHGNWGLCRKRLGGADWAR